MTMTRAEQNVDMMARLYDCRSAARGILGGSYKKTLEPWRGLIGRVMAAKELSTLQAAIDIGKHIDPSDGMSLMLAMAAAVEMIESPGEAVGAVDPCDGVVDGCPRAAESLSSLTVAAAPAPKEED